MCRLCAVTYAVSCPGVDAQIRPRPRLSTRAVAGWPCRGFAPDSADPHRLIWRRMDGLVVWLSCPTVQPHTSTSLKAARPTIRTITKFFLFLFCYFHLAIVTILKRISHSTDFTTVIILYNCTGESIPYDCSTVHICTDCNWRIAIDYGFSYFDTKFSISLFIFFLILERLGVGWSQDTRREKDWSFVTWQRCLSHLFLKNIFNILNSKRRESFL